MNTYILNSLHTQFLNLHISQLLSWWAIVSVGFCPVGYCPRMGKIVKREEEMGIVCVCVCVEV